MIKSGTRDTIKNVGVVRLTKSNKELLLDLYDNLHHYYIKSYRSDNNDLNFINAFKFENSNFTGIPDILDTALMLANKYIKEEIS